MQGYILNTKKSGENNLVMDILTPKEVIKVMRFYGVRHSSMMVGNKLDFELEFNANYLPILKESIHLGFAWQNDINKLEIFLEFIGLLSRYLNGVGECDECYYDMLEQISSRLMLQHAKRVIVDAYTKMLSHEGRLYNVDKCHICDKKLDENVYISSGFLPLCKNCFDSSFKQNDFIFQKTMIDKFFKDFNSSDFNDEQIGSFYEILRFGL